MDFKIISVYDWCKKDNIGGSASGYGEPERLSTGHGYGERIPKRNKPSRGAGYGHRDGRGNGYGDGNGGEN
jgi:hypothetical protein